MTALTIMFFTYLFVFSQKHLFATGSGTILGILLRYGLHLKACACYYKCL